MSNVFCEMDFWALVISVIALLGSGIGYLLHDNKLKKQEKKINEFTIEQFQESQDLKKKAQLSAYANIGRYGRGKFIITNTGKSIARNIRVDGFDTEKLLIIDNNALPFEYLNPGEEFPIAVLLFECSDHKLEICITWDDDWGDNQQRKQILVID